ncbi:circadian clock protein KaiB [Leptolyngbya sp. FACHB-541]|uniref:circadian clock KaiB family protein n=1 Tax=Leptolyngbya sp. FACHB-541 TaxID=2692810 RepID=UPI0016867275|nr:circadian clock KaiB family protein [Leptolyngbya sp. FACHB-541]MBD1998348.1 circadian clock protein KaiB [Leptolyngbya sp. FACHB-541]
MSYSSDSALKTQNPGLFKGIALFTPGGDLVYCIDPHKQSRWHLQLCSVLQEMLGLVEPPHFLLPCYTATIDRWLDPKTQQIQISAEACPRVLSHQALLNAIFAMEDLVWEADPRQEELCDPLVLASYRQQFPQLWEEHDLVVRLQAEPHSYSLESRHTALSWSPQKLDPPSQGYVLRLFIAGHNSATERILQNLHQLLEKSLQQPYTLKVVDIYKHPEQAEADQVAATPTLVKVWPKPVRRIAGNLEDAAKILQMLSTS